jgi:cytidylate kinase
MLISITGRLGSGKSTVCNIMKERYGYEIFSTGTINLEYARRLGITTLELNKRLNDDPSLDHEIDGTVTKLSEERKEDKLIFDSRMAWHFAEATFKIYMYVDPIVAAKRVFAADRGDVEKYESVEDAKEQLLARTFEENKRYKAIYGVDNLDFNNYDLIIDSTLASPDEIADAMIKFANEYEKEPFSANKILFAPCSIIISESSKREGEVIVSLDNGVPYCVSGSDAINKAIESNDIFVSVKII